MFSINNELVYLIFNVLVQCPYRTNEYIEQMYTIKEIDYYSRISIIRIRDLTNKIRIIDYIVKSNNN